MPLRLTAIPPCFVAAGESHARCTVGPQTREPSLNDRPHSKQEAPLVTGPPVLATRARSGPVAFASWAATNCGYHQRRNRRVPQRPGHRPCVWHSQRRTESQLLPEAQAPQASTALCLPLASQLSPLVACAGQGTRAWPLFSPPYRTKLARSTQAAHKLGGAFSCRIGHLT